MSATKESGQHRSDYFVTTRWSVVVAAGHKSSPQSDRALAELCESYWYPLYAYIRRQGHSKEDAEDLVQGFFARFLEKNYLERLSVECGKFRAFLLAALKHFLANEWDKSQRQKRGAGVQHLSLDWQGADERFHVDSSDPADLERSFDREWALALLERVIGRLRDECNADGKAQFFECAQRYLMVGETSVPYSEAARMLNLDQGAVRVAVHRLRKRYRQLLRHEIAHTLTDPTKVEEELRALQAVLSS